MTNTLPATLPAPPSAAQQAHLVNILRRTARAEILPRFRNLNAAEISTKSRPDDLVTQADLAAEAMITRALRIAFPQAVVIGEEAVSADPSLLDQIAKAPLAFIIDPIDGTWNYSKGLATFGVILAATQFGKPVFGLILDPVLDDWLIADAASLPRLCRAEGSSRPVRVAMGKAVENLSGYIPLQLFAPDRRAALAATFPGFARITSLRCSAQEYRMVAQGHTDFLLTHSLNPWDHAAGALICARAGGHVEMLDGGPYTAARHEGHLLVAPDKPTWNRLRKIFGFLVDGRD